MPNTPLLMIKQEATLTQPSYHIYKLNHVWIALAAQLAFNRPWCATSVDSSGVMPNATDSWGVCIDERETTYSFKGDIEESGRFCSLPFKMGDW